MRTTITKQQLLPLDLNDRIGHKNAAASSLLKLQTAVRHRMMPIEKTNTDIPVRMPVKIYSIHERLLIAAQQQTVRSRPERIVMPDILF